jgi:hypothetical protein
MVATVDESYLNSKAVLSAAVCVTLTTLMVIVVSARIFLRLRNRQSGADDYVMIFSMVSLKQSGISLFSDLTCKKIFCIIYNTLAIIRA